MYTLDAILFLEDTKKHWPQYQNCCDRDIVEGMKARNVLPLFCFFLLTVAQIATAQLSLGAPSGKTQLLIMPDVQRDLNLSKDQKKQIQTTMQSMNASNMQMPSDLSQMNSQMDAPLLAILNADQLPRLQELWIQYNGAKVLQDESVQKSLQLTDDQKTKEGQIWDDYGQAIMSAMQSRSMSAIKDIKKKRKDADAAALALLTADQAKAFTDMQGKPHKFPQSSQY